MTHARLTLWLLGALLALLPGLASAQVLSPGPLARPHAALEGSDDCLKCHAKGKGVIDARCLDCHTALAQRVKAKAGYHGKRAAGRACTSCHKDHLGLDTPMIRWPGGSPERFRHVEAGFPLQGKHAQLKCADCHTRARMADPAARRLKATYLGLPTRCAQCHQSDNPHGTAFETRACTDCHDQQDWASVKAFDHDRTRFKLKGKHTDAKCDQCHTGTVFSQTPHACDACHNQRHVPKANFPARCDVCHSATGWGRISFPAKAHSVFPLTGGHTLKAPEMACRTCHGEQGNRAPGPQCAGCHTDPHGGRLGQRCQGCHTIQSWKQVRQSAIDHERTRFPLRGAHTSVACAQCHVGGKLSPLPHSQCTDCHRDPHEGAVGARCEDCHAVEGFQPSTYRLAAHTTFALTGAHLAVGCDQCHRPTPPGAASSGPWDFRKGAAACTDCHTDPHAGQFAPRGCTDCHSADAWQPASGFDHAAAWSLEGKHAEAPCAHCHTDGQFADTPQACEACHGSPHLGQFADAHSGVEARPTQACADCHTPTATWKGHYDHAQRWPLEGAHAKAECSDCHREIRVADGRTTTHWRLGFQDCKRCHQNPHERRP